LSTLPGALPPVHAGEVQFSCDDGAGGELKCILEREAEQTRASCERGALFQTRWVCNLFPELDAAICRSRDSGQRILKQRPYEDDRFLCSSLCFCP